MRGKVQTLQFYNVCNRITPAYAGKSAAFSLSDAFMNGSPPPMRGKVYGSSEVLDMFGITPAYAGKSFQTLSGRAFSRDHPRLCGEK